MAQSISVKLRCCQMTSASDRVISAVLVRFDGDLSPVNLIKGLIPLMHDTENEYLWVWVAIRVIFYEKFISFLVRTGCQAGLVGLSFSGIRQPICQPVSHRRNHGHATNRPTSLYPPSVRLFFALLRDWGCCYCPDVQSQNSSPKPNPMTRSWAVGVFGYCNVGLKG